MRWATKRRIRISRAATAWLIRRFVDTAAEFVFLDDDAQVLAAERDGAIGFHCKGTRYPKRGQDGRTPFEALVAEHAPSDVALGRLAGIVKDADGPAGHEEFPEAVGLRLMTVAFPEVANDDYEILERSAFLYDSLYVALTKTVTAQKT